MKKKITALGLLLALLLELCGCGKSEPVKNTAVKNAEALIDAIGTVTVDSAEAVEAAEAAYNALSEEERGQVSNAARLTEARQALNAAVEEARLEALRLSLTGTWETQMDVRDRLVEEMDSQFSGAEISFGDYLGDCVLTLRLELGENGVYRLSFDAEHMEVIRQTVREATASFISDYLLFYIGHTLEESGIQGDFSTREGIESAMGMNLDEIISNYLHMELETHIDQVATEVDPESMFSFLWGEGRFTVTETALYFSVESEKETDDGSGVPFSLSGDGLTMNVPDESTFPLTGSWHFTRLG